jgi:hypothetical protein
MRTWVEAETAIEDAVSVDTTLTIALLSFFWRFRINDAHGPSLLNDRLGSRPAFLNPSFEALTVITNLLHFIDGGQSLVDSRR